MAWFGDSTKKLTGFVKCVKSTAAC